MTPLVAVVTVTYNTGATLETFLASVPGASVDGLAVIVVDNNSRDLDQIRRITEAHGAHLIPSSDNLGYGGGIRLAFQHLPAEIEFVLISNPDVTLTSGSIDVLVAAARRLPRAAAVGPRILEPNGDVYPSARSLPSLRSGVGHALFANVWPGNPWTRSYWAANKDIVEREAGWLSGACLLVRRRAFEDIGGFDAGYFMYFEDVDLGARFTAANWINVYIPDATVVHTGAHSTTHTAGAMDRVHHASAYRYLSKRYPGWHLAPLRLALRVGLALRRRWRQR